MQSPVDQHAVTPEKVDLVLSAISFKKATTYSSNLVTMMEGAWHQQIMVEQTVLVLIIKLARQLTSKSLIHIHRTVYDITNMINSNSNMKETVYTFPKYIENAATLLESKGATVIIASQTPDNTCESSSSCVYTPSRFVDLAKVAAQSSKDVFIDHGAYVAAAYKTLGKSVVDKYYPHDHTHTSPAGSTTVAKAFILGLSCSSSTLKRYIKSGAASGKCIS